VLQEEVNRTLGEGAVYITMVRDPVELFESMWNYAALYNYYKMDLETFVKSPKLGLLAQV
jgi:hypothetical protein